jgi:hypothetical protein
MNESILINIREMCDVGKDVDSFDGQLIPLINTFLFRSAQFGVGKRGFRITGPNETWDDFIETDAEYFVALKNYIAIRVRLIFDPPDSSALLTALKEEARELEWCLYDEAEVGG